MTTVTAAMTNPAFVLRAVKDVGIEDRPIPELREEYEVRVHVAQTGICGSDVHYWQRGRIGDFILTSPIILGHESSGVVVECGSKVKNLKKGDRVAIEPGVPCRRCDYCRDAKYYTVASDFCYPIPDHMDMEQAAMVEPVACAVQMCKVAGQLADKAVVVFGCGAIGVLCQAVAKAQGARRVIGIDLSQARVNFAKDFSADEAILPPRPSGNFDEPIQRSEKVAGMMKEQFGLGEGADVVIECTGAEPCIQAGVYVLRKGGTLSQAGMGRENITFPITTACIRGLTIKGSIRYTHGCYPTAVNLVASGKIDVKRLITNRFKFEEAEKAFDLVKAAKEGVFKVIIEGVQG
ncbi:GroES-like protein [Saccharata proteae CBS 121410]|uniref:D-xylulose reductase n=1 Tax=Saccharata proteae CBS 121410 TaxID=1314787 RepID=A0A9P4HY75_9PEZI|nr:GroES-like protein [Saccharata proteae CBS 121410]